METITFFLSSLLSKYFETARLTWFALKVYVPFNTLKENAHKNTPLIQKKGLKEYFT